VEKKGTWEWIVPYISPILVPPPVNAQMNPLTENSFSAVISLVETILPLLDLILVCFVLVRSISEKWRRLLGRRLSECRIFGDRTGLVIEVEKYPSFLIVCIGGEVCVVTESIAQRIDQPYPTLVVPRYKAVGRLL
jgi:hypothetical protein